MAGKRAAVFTESAAREVIRAVKRINKSPRGVPIQETPYVVNPAVMQFVSPTSTTNAHVQIWTVTQGDGATVHEKQAVAVVWATGGTFTLTFDSGGPQTTAAIAWNASASAVKSALEALSNITTVTVTGSGTGSDPWLVTFEDSATNYAQMTATSSCTPAIISGTRYERSPGTWTARDTVFIEVPNSETPTAGTKYPAEVVGKVYYNGVTYLVYMLHTVPSTSAAFSGMLVASSGSQTLTNNTPTVVTFWSGAEDYDLDSYHESATHPSRFTATTSGYYVFTTRILFASNATGIRRIGFAKNGGADLWQDDEDASGGGTQTVLTGTSWPFAMSAGDYMEVTAYQNSGGNLDLQGHKFAGYKVGS